MTSDERLDRLEAEVIALRRAFVAFATLFKQQSERAEIILRDGSEQVFREAAQIGACRLAAEAGIRLADDLAEHSAYLHNLEREGNGLY